MEKEVNVRLDEGRLVGRDKAFDDWGDTDLSTTIRARFAEGDGAFPGDRSSFLFNPNKARWKILLTLRLRGLLPLVSLMMQI